MANPHPAVTSANATDLLSQAEHEATDLVLEALEFARRINDRLHHDDHRGSTDLHVAVPKTPAA